MLRLDDQWIWDSWIADDGETYHLYYLQAPRALGDMTLRHARATVGHATSTDLVGWTVQGTALQPSDEGWDDLATWTGSVVRDGRRWLMFYTALGRARGHGLLDQRIGVVESDDLVTWRRFLDHPVLDPDPARYATVDGTQDGPGPPASETWRDPFVFPDPAGDGWRMLVTARLPGAPRYDDGTLAAAHSRDLITWELGDPVSGEPAGFGQVEVAQVREVDGEWVLVFTCGPEEQAPARRAAYGEWCTWSVVGESALGPWDLTRAVPFTAERWLFAAPLVRRRDGTWALLGFLNLEAQGRDGFRIGDPIPVCVGETEHGRGLVAR